MRRGPKRERGRNPRGARGRDAGLGAECRNPFQSIVVRAVETLYAVDEALRLIEAYEPPVPAAVDVIAGDGTDGATRRLVADVLRAAGATDVRSLAPDEQGGDGAPPALVVRLGAAAVGHTLYVGSPRQDEALAPLRQVRQDSDRSGMPLIVWSYPRGSAVEAKGGKDSFYAVDYAARVASELGADVVKVNFPHPEKRTGAKAPYDQQEFSTQEAISAVVRSANHTLLLVSGGSKAGDEAMLDKARQSMEAGATGLIFGRNIWQRPHDESLRLVERLREILAKYPGD